MTTQALIATRKGLFCLSNENRLSPVDAFIGVPVTQVLARADSPCWFAALDHGHFGVKMQRSDDAGKSWKEVNAPRYPKADNREEGDALKLIWSLEFADHDNDNQLWAGTVPGGLFRSDDGGDNWRLNDPLWQFKREQEWFGGGFDDAGIHSICVHPENPSKVLVAVSCAGVWSTNDGGKSWTNKSKGMRAEYMPPDQAYDPNIQDPHRLVRCHSSPDSLWVQHHNGIFYSNDGAESWTEVDNVNPSAFGFAVAVHPDDPKLAWFVPAEKDENRVPVDGRFVVTRTQNGGQSFDVLSQGLPGELSYDLVFRHSLDVDASGQRLLMGSTTGNLWLSNDQGAHWQCLSHHLPPIYAVRFIK